MLLKLQQLTNQYNTKELTYYFLQACASGGGGCMQSNN